MSAAGEPTNDDHAVLERILGRVAHDVRGPAGVATGALAELERALEPQGAEFSQLVKMVQRSLARLLRTADRYAFTAEALHGSLPLQREPLDPRKVLEEAAAETVRVFARRGIAFDVDLPPDLAPIHADRRWLAVAVGECVSVALRYARSKVTIRARQTPDHFDVFVEYDGDIQPRSFDRFDPDADGDVLALALARDAATAHGGVLLSEPTASGGTALHLSVPTGPTT